MTIIELLNRQNGATAASISAQTGLTGGTVYRILETLRADGFVRKDEGSPHYWLGQRVRALSEGYADAWWIDAFGRAVIEDLGREVRWPVKLCTLNGSHLVARVTTDFSSPFTSRRYPSGQKVRLFTSAAGHVFLAFCSDGERALILAAMEEEAGPDRPVPPPRFEALLDQVRADGFAVFDHPEESFFTLAVPIVAAGAAPLGCVVVHVFRRVLRPSAGPKTLLEPLQRAAAHIAERHALGMPSHCEDAAIGGGAAAVLGHG